MNKEIGYSKDGFKAITTAALLDSGATTSFISKQIVQDMGLNTHEFPTPIPLLNIDGMTNTAGRITLCAFRSPHTNQRRTQFQNNLHSNRN